MNTACRGIVWALAACACLSVAALAGALVGELLGLTVNVTLSDGQAFVGEVVGETAATLTLSVAGQQVTIARSEISAIALAAGAAAAAPSALQDPVFAEVRRRALERTAGWRVVKDGIAAAQAVALSVYAATQPADNHFTFLGVRLGLGVASWVWDLLARPSLDERLLWQSKLPVWHGLVGFAGGVADLGGSVSLVLGFVQETVTLPDLAPSRDWFSLAGTLFLAEAGAALVHVFYDVAVLLAPQTD